VFNLKRIMQFSLIILWLFFSGELFACYIELPQYLCWEYWEEYSAGGVTDTNPSSGSYFPVEGGKTVRYSFSLYNSTKPAGAYNHQLDVAPHEKSLVSVVSQPSFDIPYQTTENVYIEYAAPMVIGNHDITIHILNENGDRISSENGMTSQIEVTSLPAPPADPPSEPSYIFGSAAPETIELGDDVEFQVAWDDVESDSSVEVIYCNQETTCNTASLDWERNYAGSATSHLFREYINMSNPGTYYYGFAVDGSDWVWEESNGDYKLFTVKAGTTTLPDDNDNSSTNDDSSTGSDNSVPTDNSSVNCAIQSPQYLCLNYWEEYSSDTLTKATPEGSKYFPDDYYFPVKGGSTVKHTFKLYNSTKSDGAVAHKLAIADKDKDKIVVASQPAFSVAYKESQNAVIEYTAPTALGKYDFTIHVLNDKGERVSSDTGLVRGIEVTSLSSDAQAPSITISSPANNTSTEAETINISGTATDNVGVVQVTWKNSRGGSGNAVAATMIDGTTSWNQDITLHGGINVITVTAHDAVGLQSSVSLTITRNITNCASLSVIHPTTSTLLMNTYKTAGIITNTDPKLMETRGTYARILVKTIEKHFRQKLRPLPNNASTKTPKSRFTDIATSTFEKDILKLEALYRNNPHYNITNNRVNTVKVLLGNNTLFQPDKKITRIEALILTVNMYEFFSRKEIILPFPYTPAFLDSPSVAGATGILDLTKNFANAYFMQKGFERKLTSGYAIQKDASGKAMKRCFAPNNQVPRHESVAFVDKLIKELNNPTHTTDKDDLGRINVSLEMDLMDGVNGNTWPAFSAADTSGTTKTLVNIYSEVGVDLDVDQPAAPTFNDPRCIVPANPTCGQPLIDTELHALMTTPSSNVVLAPGQWHIRAFFLPIRARLDATGNRISRVGNPGVMFESPTRTGFAIFMNVLNTMSLAANNFTIREQAYLRTTAHELGHALNFLHNDGNGDTTIMNQTQNINASWVYEWNHKSLNHIYSHPLKRLKPATQYEFGECHNTSTPVDLQVLKLP